VQQHHRFGLVPAQQQQQQQQEGVTVGTHAASELVQFTAVGSPLHGVVADEVSCAGFRVLGMGLLNHKPWQGCQINCKCCTSATMAYRVCLLQTVCKACHQ
jgi:hypothetical protein